MGKVKQLRKTKICGLIYHWRGFIEVRRFFEILEVFFLRLSLKRANR